MKHKTFTFRSSWFEAMRNMSDASRLALMDAICRYAFDGELPDPEALDPVAEIAFMLIRAEIDATPSRRKRHIQTDTPSSMAGLPDTTHEDTPQATVAPDEFDTAYDEVAARVRQNEKWRSWLKTHAEICNLRIAIPEFKKFIRKHGRTDEFTGREMAELDFCRRLVEASDVCRFLPADAFRTVCPKKNEAQAGARAS